jgi:hypothetical protein
VSDEWRSRGREVLYFQRPNNGSRPEDIYLDNVGEQGTHSPPSHVGPRGFSHPPVMASLHYLHVLMGGGVEMRSGVPSAAQRVKLAHYSAPLVNRLVSSPEIIWEYALAHES